MANSLNEALKTLLGSREGVLPSADVFPVTDVEQLAVELRVSERGLEDGAANLPSTTDVSETAVESDIRAEIERRASKASRDYLAQIDLYDGRIQRAAITEDLRTSIEAAGETALADFSVQVTDDISHLYRDQQEMKGRHGEFVSFRAANGLHRLPRPVHHVTSRWLIIAVLFLLESFINGSLFAEGSQTGLIGGVTQAVVLSLFNIGSAVGFGRLVLPYLRHSNRLFQVLSALATTAFVLWSVLLNLAIGHFRDLFIQHQGRVELETLRRHLFADPFGLADTTSLVLVGLGLFFSAVAVIDVRGLDDPFPGYGPIGRRLDSAIAVYSDHRSRCLEDLKSRRADAISEMSQVIEGVRRRQHEVQLAINGRFRLHQQYDSYVEHLRDCHVRLIQRYREANVRARTSAPPSQFAGPPAIPRSLAPPPPLSERTADLQINQHVIDRMEYFIREMSSQYEAQARRYAPVAEVIERVEDDRSNG